MDKTNLLVFTCDSNAWNRLSKNGRKIVFNKMKDVSDSSKSNDNNNNANQNESNEKLKNAFILTNKLMALLDNYRYVLKNHKCFNEMSINGDDKEIIKIINFAENEYNSIIEKDFPNVYENSYAKIKDIMKKNVMRKHELTLNDKERMRLEIRKTENYMSLDENRDKTLNDDYIDTFEDKTYDFSKYKVIFGGNITCDWPECDYSHSRIDCFKHHMYKHFNITPYKCDYLNCKSEFSSVSGLISHKSLFHSSSNRIICSLPNCSMTFKHESSYRVHLSRHNEPYTNCPFKGCKRKTKYPNGVRFKRHIASHPGLEMEKQFKCSAIGCEKIFHYPSDLNKHNKRHTKVKNVKCEYDGCERMFSSKRSMQTHIAIHTAEMNYLCDMPECDFRTNIQSKLVYHKLIHSGVKNFVCTFPGCDSRFAMKNRLKIHMQTHSDVKPHKCPWPGCEQRFRQIFSLNCHMESHSEGKNFLCSFPGCDRKFKTERTLKRHKSTHMGVKRFACDWPGCDYRSYYSGSISTHKVVHSGVKKFVCTWPGCELKCATRQGLKGHLMIHKGDKPYMCEWPECGRRFVDYGNMKKHMKNIHHSLTSN